MLFQKEKEDKNQINRLDQKRERRSRRAFFLLSLGNKKHTQIIFIGHSPFRVFPRCVQMIQNVRQVA